MNQWVAAPEGVETVLMMKPVRLLSPVLSICLIMPSCVSTKHAPASPLPLNSRPTSEQLERSTKELKEPNVVLGMMIGLAPFAIPGLIIGSLADRKYQRREEKTWRPYASVLNYLDQSGLWFRTLTRPDGNELLVSSDADDTQRARINSLLDQGRSNGGRYIHLIYPNTRARYPFAVKKHTP